MPFQVLLRANAYIYFKDVSTNPENYRFITDFLPQIIFENREKLPGIKRSKINDCP